MTSLNEGLDNNCHVLRYDGEIILAREIREGDRIKGFDEKNDCEAIQKVVQVTPTSFTAMSSAFCAPNTKVFDKSKRTWTPAGTEFSVRHGRFPGVVLTVEPNHTILLEDEIIVHNKGGSQPTYGTTKTDQTQTFANINEPWWAAQPHLLGIMQGAQQAYEGGKWGPYRGSLYARTNPMQKTAYRNLVGPKRGFVDQLRTGYAPTRQLALDMLGGQYLYADKNPYLQSAMSAANRNVENLFARSVFPNISSQAQMQGAYGGARHGIAQGVASGELAQAASDTAARMSAENLARERALQMQAPQLLQQANALQVLPEELRMKLGEWKQAEKQQQLDARFKKWQLNKQAPFLGVQQYADVLSRLGLGGYGTQSGTQTTNALTTAPFGMQQSAAAGALGGLFGGAGLGSLIGGPWTWLGGGLGGLFGGLF